MSEQDLLQAIGMPDGQIVDAEPETRAVKGTDAAGNPTTVSQPTGNTILTVSDGRGALAQVAVRQQADPTDPSVTTYALVGLPKRVTAPSSSAANPAEAAAKAATAQADAAKAQDAAGLADEQAAEREANAAAGNGYYTNAELDRLQQAIQSNDSQTQLRMAQQAEANALAAKDQADAAVAQATAPDQVAKARAQAASAAAAAQNAQLQLQLDQEKLALAQAKDPVALQQAQADLALTQSKLQESQATVARTVAEVQGQQQKNSLPTTLPADTTAPFLVQLVPDGRGGWTMRATPNPNQLTVSQAMMQAASGMAPLVGVGPDAQVPLETAKALMTAYYQQMDVAARQLASGVSYADSVASNTARMMEDANSYAVSPGTLAYVNARRAGASNAPPPPPLTQLPYSPDLVASVAAGALAHVSPTAAQYLQRNPLPGGPFVSPDATVPAAPGSGGFGPPPGLAPRAADGGFGAPPGVQPRATDAGFTAPTVADGSGHTITINIGGAGAGTQGGAARPAGANPSFTVPSASPSLASFARQGLQQVTQPAAAGGGL